MVVPTSVGRWLFTVGWTSGNVLIALGQTAALNDEAAVTRWTPFWARGLAKGWGMEVVAHGREHLEPGETYVIMANHRSHVDIIALFEALPVLPGFLAKRELRRIPLFGRAMEVGGHVFIDRTKRKHAFDAIASAAAQVRAGATIVVFPEGTRARQEGVKPFKKGGFHLAKQAGVAILPVGIRGSAEILPKHEYALRPGRVDVNIGEPIARERVGALPVADLMALARDRICELSDLPPVGPDRGRSKGG